MHGGAIIGFILPPIVTQPTELSLDFFGSYLAGERRAEDLFKTNIRHGAWGGGVGVNYFSFAAYFGCCGGHEYFPTDHGGNFVNNVYGSLIARFPIANTGWRRMFLAVVDGKRSRLGMDRPCGRGNGVRFNP